MENRNELVTQVAVQPASGTAEREAAIEMLATIPGEQRVTVGADKAYDTKGFVEQARELNVTPHVAQNNNKRKSAIDGRTTRHGGYGISGNGWKRSSLG
jgi:hypothetical protein